MIFYYAPLENEDDLWVQMATMNPPRPAMFEYRNLTAFIQTKDWVYIGETVYPTTATLLVQCQ